MPTSFLCMLRLPFQALLTLLVLASLSFWSTRAFGGISAGSKHFPCESKILDTQLEWTSSALWTANDRELLVVDPLYRRILRYSYTGRGLGPIPQGIGAALENLAPVIIKPYRAGWILQLADEHMLILDGNYIPRKRVDLRQVGERDDAKLEGVWLWTPAGDDLVALGDLHRLRDSSWNSGFIRFPLTAPGRFTLLRPVFQEALEFYRLGFPYLTSLGDTAYVVAMDKTARLLRMPKDGPVTELGVSLPRRDLPSLPAYYRSNDLPVVMDAVERSTMPVGLYGWEGSLYLLSRAPEPGEGTAWVLTQIDPLRDRIVGSVNLPTRADHLTVVPGANRWAFMEKGPVRSWGRQNVERVLFVPASRFKQVGWKGELCQ